MSIALESSTVRETNLSQAPTLLRSQPQSLNWLFIAHNDELMNQAICDAAEPNSSAILRIPQHQWDFECEDLRETLHSAIEYSGLQHLALVGHSDAMGDANAASRTSEEATADSSEQEEATTSRLFAGAERVEQQIAEAKSMFAESVLQFSKIPSVNLAIEAGNLQLHGLFYLAHSGTFLGYDPSSKLYFPVS